jgi:hypothetical protein
MRALLAAVVVAVFASPALENPGVPCVGFYVTTCSLIDLVPENPAETPGAVVDTLCRRVDCPAVR